MQRTNKINDLVRDKLSGLGISSNITEDGLIAVSRDDITEQWINEDAGLNRVLIYLREQFLGYHLYWVGQSDNHFFLDILKEA